MVVGVGDIERAPGDADSPPGSSNCAFAAGRRRWPGLPVPASVFTLRFDRIEHLDLVVVGVGDVDAPVVAWRRPADAAAARRRPCRPCRRTRTGRRRRACATVFFGGRSIARMMLASASATNRSSPSIARPDGWAKAASSMAPSSRASGRSRRRPGDAARRVDHPDLVRAGHGDVQERAVTARSHGEFSATSRAPRRPRRHAHCSPVPAIGRDRPALEVHRRGSGGSRCRPRTACRRSRPCPAAC